ncbi:hypothetical protein V2J56_09180 [Georgenia sp. MJ206]|uniref:hypothetical protein n=1 Tax=Georgenia wangjunii TaxID=3117730 RepID=UPI002F268303
MDGMTEDEREAAIWAKREEIAKHVQQLAELQDRTHDPDDPPYVQAWALAWEWTNVELERENRGGRDLATPRGQALSTSLGLGTYLADRHRQFADPV